MGREGWPDVVEWRGLSTKLGLPLRPQVELQGLALETPAEKVEMTRG